MARRALVTGAHGIVGLNVIEELLLDPEWQVTSIGRRPGAPMAGVDHVSGDLTDAASTRAALAGCGDVSYLFFGAFLFDADPIREAALNVAMLQNTLDGLKEIAGGLEVVAEGWRTGPTATMLVFVLEYAKLLVPWKAWRVAAHGVLGWVLFPLRYLDLWLLRKPRAAQIGNHCYLWLRKRA